jgi:protein-L-isoaspartate(D-aspartate) O-methyltransferase
MQSVEEAFKAVDRKAFLPQEARDAAWLDSPIPIGYGQTNSQPSTVRMMLEWLGPQPGEKILDVGSGSGWTTALLSYLVGPEGKVYAVEKIPELVQVGSENCQKAGINNAQFFEAGDVYGLPDFAPYDRILVSAAAKELPQELLDQLVVGGRLVIPIGSSIHAITKTTEAVVDDKEYRGFAFVPLL